MEATPHLTDEQLDARVLSILQRELNLEEFARYLRRHRVGKGDYTRDRHLWLDRVTIDDLIPELGITDGEQTKR